MSPMQQLEETRGLAQRCYFQPRVFSLFKVQEFTYSQQKLPASSFNNRFKAKPSPSSQNTTLPPGIFLLLSISFGKSSSQPMMKGHADITGSSPALCLLETGAQPRQKVSTGMKMLPRPWEQSPLPGAVNLQRGVTQPCPVTAVTRGHVGSKAVQLPTLLPLCLLEVQHDVKPGSGLGIHVCGCELAMKKATPGSM